MHKTVAFWAPDRCDVCRNWLQEAKKEKADGKDKGPIWRGLKVWVMGFEKSKRVKGLAVIPEEHRDFLFPAPSPLPEDPASSNPQGNLLQVGLFNLFETPAAEPDLTRQQEEELLAGTGPSSIVVLPDLPPRSPSIPSTVTSTVAPSQPQTPDISSSEEEEDMEVGEPGANKPLQPPTQPQPVPQVPEDPQTAWMALQMNQSKMIMDMVNQMQQQFKGMQEEISKLKGAPDETPVPSPAPEEPMEPDAPEKEVLKDDPHNPWRACNETQLSPDKSMIQGVRPDGTPWSLPTASIRFEDFSKYPDTRWRMDLSSSAAQQPTQKEKILIEMEAANKGISDLMERLKIMYHGPGFFQTIKGFAIDPSEVPVTRKVFGHAQEFARAIVKGGESSQVGRA